MNKAELIDTLANKTGLTKKTSETAVNTLVDIMTEELKKGEKVQLFGFGSFEVKERKERVARNPKTMEEVTVPASRAVHFKVGKLLKQAMANK